MKTLIVNVPNHITADRVKLAIREQCGVSVQVTSADRWLVSTTYHINSKPHETVMLGIYDNERAARADFSIQSADITRLCVVVEERRADDLRKKYEEASWADKTPGSGG